jgi:hypothetical protein
MLRLAEEPGLWARLAANGPTSAARFGWEPFVKELDDRLEAGVLGRIPEPSALAEANA